MILVNVDHNKGILCDLEHIQQKYMGLTLAKVYHHKYLQEMGNKDNQIREVMYNLVWIDTMSHMVKYNQELVMEFD